MTKVGKLTKAAQAVEACYVSVNAAAQELCSAARIYSESESPMDENSLYLAAMKYSACMAQKDKLLSKWVKSH